MSGRIHPAFKVKFTSPLYRSRSDDFAPFGSDEGALMLDEWSARTEELSDTTTVRDVLLDGAADPDGLWAEFIQEPAGGELDVFVIAAGFVLLRFTGQIDDQGRELVLAALQRSREMYPMGAPHFDQMTADLGGEVPTTPAMSDELREMLDPNFGPPLPRHSWLFLSASRWVDSKDLELPVSYRHQLNRLRKKLNADPQWWEWWDAGFPGEAVVLDMAIEFSDSPRRSYLGSSRDRDWRWIRARVGAPTGPIADMSRKQLDTPAMEFARLANDHVAAVVGAVAAKHRLGPRPELPRPRD